MSQLWLYVAVIPLAVLLHEYLRLDLKRAVYRRTFILAMQRMSEQLAIMQKMMTMLGLAAEEAGKNISRFMTAATRRET
jgi:hypothetical protein